MAQPRILRVKTRKSEDATPETLVVAAPPSKRRTRDQSLAALSTEQPQNVLHRFRKLEKRAGAGPRRGGRAEARVATAPPQQSRKSGTAA